MMCLAIREMCYSTWTEGTCGAVPGDFGEYNLVGLSVHYQVIEI